LFRMINLPHSLGLARSIFRHLGGGSHALRKPVAIGYFY
jgi:hypothetical protein